MNDPAKAGRIAALSSLVAIVTGAVMTVALALFAPWIASRDSCGAAVDRAAAYSGFRAFLWRTGRRTSTPSSAQLPVEHQIQAIETQATWLRGKELQKLG